MDSRIVRGSLIVMGLSIITAAALFVPLGEGAVPEINCSAIPDDVPLNTVRDVETGTVSIVLTREEIYEFSSGVDLAGCSQRVRNLIGEERAAIAQTRSELAGKPLREICEAAKAMGHKVNWPNEDCSYAPNTRHRDYAD